MANLVGVVHELPHRIGICRDLLLTVVLQIHDCLPCAFRASASRIARHTLSRVTGISMCRTPSGESASTTALTNAAGLPTFGLSPTPFAPIGWCGLGVTVLLVSQCGVSSDVGRR